MKPFTPRIRMRFMTAGSACSCFFDLEEAQDFTIAALREPLTLGFERTSLAGAAQGRFHAGTENLHAVGKGARIGRGHRAHEVMDLLRALRPVDLPIPRLSPAEVAAFRKILRRQCRFS